MTAYEHCRDIFKTIRTRSGVYVWDSNRMVRVADAVQTPEWPHNESVQGNGKDSDRTRREAEGLVGD